MFFILSKVLIFLIKPINWIVGCLLYVIFGKNKKWQKRCLWASVIMVFLFGNHFLFNQVVKLWEVDTITIDQIDQTYDIGIVLGGYSNLNLHPDDGRHNFSDRANRLTTALELYHLGKIDKLLLSGGTGRILADEPSEAILVKGFLERIGIPSEDILIEQDSRNTYENAVFTKKLVREKFPDSRCLLITSAWHMRRAKSCFRKVDLPVTPFSSDYMGEYTRIEPQSIILPYAAGYGRWELLIKEWVGYLAYKLTGKA